MHCGTVSYCRVKGFDNPCCKKQNTHVLILVFSHLSFSGIYPWIHFSYPCFECLSLRFLPPSRRRLKSSLFSTDVQSWAQYKAGPAIMSQSHYLCGFNSVVSDAFWDPGQCSAGRFSPPETLIYQRIGKLEGSAATFTAASTTTASFSRVWFWSLRNQFRLWFLWSCFVVFLLPSFSVCCCAVDADLFTLGLDFASMWISATPTIVYI